MFNVAEKFANRNNIVFSTDPSPVKSKSKCMYLCGRSGEIVYPDPLILNGRPLPWVKTSVHLGPALLRPILKKTGQTIICNVGFSSLKLDNKWHLKGDKYFILLYL